MDEGTVDWWLNLWRKLRELWRPCLWQEVEEIKNKTQIRLYFWGNMKFRQNPGGADGCIRPCLWFGAYSVIPHKRTKSLCSGYCWSFAEAEIMVFEIWDTYLRPGSGFAWIWFCWWLIILVTPFLERALGALLVQEQTYMEWSFTLICLLTFNTEILLTLDFIINFSWIVSDDMTESSCLSQVFAKKVLSEIWGDSCTLILLRADQFKWEPCKCTSIDDDGDDLILHDM